MRISVIYKVVARIRARDGGVVSVSDLTDAGPRATVDKALSRLVKQGKVLRVRRGLYAWPRKSTLLNQTAPPPPDEMVCVWARKNGLKIVPAGALAANLLGLSTQVPARLVYYTNGRSKTLTFGSHTVKLLNRGPKIMDVRGRISPMVFQALRYLGKNGMTQQVVSHLSKLIPAKDRKELKRNLPRASAWMKPVLEKIIEGRRN